MRSARQILSKSILRAFPESVDYSDSLWPAIREAKSINPKRIIVLDDDPTGCQSVYDIDILLDYSVETIANQLEKDNLPFYILTNTRSLSEFEAIQVTFNVLENLQAARQSVTNELFCNVVKFKCTFDCRSSMLIQFN